MRILETGWIIQFMQCHGRSSIMAAVLDGDLGDWLDHSIYAMSW